jgi:glutathione S-transferase
MSLPIKPSFPWLLYAYPWMPFPRRVIIYLRERKIPSSLITIVPVTDPHRGAQVPPNFPPKPPGSLPQLLVPCEADSGDSSIVFRQSASIINYIEELCTTGAYGFPKADHCMAGATPLERAHVTDVLAQADECMGNWNAVRLFGTGAGPMSIPAASKESLRWVRRALLAVETWWKERDVSALKQGGVGKVLISDIVMYEFLEFVSMDYGKDLTVGSGQIVKDPYGRDVQESFDKLKEFFQTFGGRDSVKRVESYEWPSEGPKNAMQTWAEGIW